MLGGVVALAMRSPGRMRQVEDCHGRPRQRMTESHRSGVPWAMLKEDAPSKLAVLMATTRP